MKVVTTYEVELKDVSDMIVEILKISADPEQELSQDKMIILGTNVRLTKFEYVPGGTQMTFSNGQVFNVAIEITEATTRGKIIEAMGVRNEAPS